VPYIKVGEENSGSIDLYYEDHGSGPPVVLIHGYPLSGRAWDKQVPVLLAAGCRVITYDRRGFGQSSQPTSGYDYDTFAADLRTLMDALDLSDATLVGHSMGAGETTHYLGTYGSGRVAKAVLVSAIPPFLPQAGDNPDGVPQRLFDGFAQAARADTPAWMKAFLDNFYNLDTLAGTLVSDQAYQASWNLAVTASATAAVACIRTWATDFRDDLPNIGVPMLVIHSDADRTLPYDKTAERLSGLIKDMQSSPSKAARTPLPGPTPTRSTARCSTSCASKPSGHPGAQVRRPQPPMPSHRGRTLVHANPAAVPPPRQSPSKEPPCPTTSAPTTSSPPAATRAWTSPTCSPSSPQTTLTRRC
jgi:non-heme chloroperoxidase